MSVRIVIAAQRPETGKSRLAPLLDPYERAALNRQMFMHVLGVALEVAKPDHCFVISPSFDVLCHARRRGAAPILEAKPGLNAAFAQASMLLAARSDDPILTLSCDLPLLSTAELSELIEKGRHAHVVLATDVDRSGTNALILRRPGLLPYCYGALSLARHRSAAERLGLGFEIFRRVGLERDVDTPDQYLELRGSTQFVQRYGRSRNVS